MLLASSQRKSLIERDWFLPIVPIGRIESVWTNRDRFRSYDEPYYWLYDVENNFRLADRRNYVAANLSQKRYIYIHARLVTFATSMTDGNKDGGRGNARSDRVTTAEAR